MEFLGLDMALFNEAAISLMVATLCGIVIGVERMLAHKTTGMRTYALVSMGAALFIIIGQLAILQGSYAGTDPLRIASQIITGVGFLGAGIIVTKDAVVTGVTTASSIWVAAGIGMAAGFKLYSIAIFVTVVTVIIFTVLWFVEEKIKNLIK